MQDHTFDVSVSLNGVSLFPDFDGGLAELVRVEGSLTGKTTTGDMPFESATHYWSALTSSNPIASS